MYRGRCVYHDFNPLPPCGGRLRGTETTAGGHRFQSTPSVWRETVRDTLVVRSVMVFQSTPSVWRETRGGRDGGRERAISIHSLRVEGDSWAFPVDVQLSNFNPLPPCGGRRWTSRIFRMVTSFQSTPSVWRETRHFCRPAPQRSDFNPLPPCGGRQ